MNAIHISKVKSYKMPWINILWLGIAIGITGCIFSNTATLTVNNESGKLISTLNIVLGEETQIIHNLRNGHSETISFDISHDAHYEIQGMFEDGKTFQGRYGYVTHGMDFSDNLIFMNSVILFTQ
jgi:hypothetical protein